MKTNGNGNGKVTTGRPRKVFDLRQVEALGSIGCSQAEIASVLGCHVRTVESRLATDGEFSRAYKKGLTAMKKALRRRQFELALGGNASLLIWLGKTVLGQHETVQTESAVTVKGGSEKMTPEEQVKVWKGMMANKLNEHDRARERG